MVTAAGFLSQPIDRCRLMVARSATFQALTGSADEAAALAKCFLFEIPASENGWLCLLDWDSIAFDRQAINNRSAYGGSRWLAAGAIELFFQASFASLDVSDPDLDFANKIGAILDEISAQCGGRDTINIITMTAQPPMRPDAESVNGQNLVEIAITLAFRLPING